MSSSEQTFLQFAKPELDQATIDEVVDCLRSGWLSSGPRVAEFEKLLANYWHAPNVIALNSASAGFHLALKCCGVGQNDEVITSPITFVAALNSIVHVGATPVLVDIDPLTLSLNLDAVEAAITPRTKAIIPVHFAGVPMDLDRLNELAQRYDLRVIEDCTHATGSIYKDRILGSFGDIQVFSFHPDKVITAGEGGCLVTRDEQLAYEVRAQRFHGIDREVLSYGGLGVSAAYDVISPGYKYSMTDIQAAIGIHQLQRLEEFITKREALVVRYNQLLSGWDKLILPVLPSYDCRVSWYIYAPRLNLASTDLTREAFVNKMKEQNIGTGYHFRAAHLYSFYQQRFNFKAGQFPEAEKASSSVFSLPLFSQMSRVDQDRVVEALHKVLD